MYKIYILISALGMFVRGFLLPNPFDQLPHPVTIHFSGIMMAVPAALLNWIMEPVLYSFTYIIVGFYYTKGENPAKGSLLYLLFYSIHVGLLALMARTQFTLWAVILILAGYFACHAGVAIIRNRVAVGGIE